MAATAGPPGPEPPPSRKRAITHTARSQTCTPSASSPSSPSAPTGPRATKHSRTRRKRRKRRKATSSAAANPTWWRGQADSRPWPDQPPPELPAGRVWCKLHAEGCLACSPLSDAPIWGDDDHRCRNDNCSHPGIKRENLPKHYAAHHPAEMQPTHPNHARAVAEVREALGESAGICVHCTKPHVCRSLLDGRCSKARAAERSVPREVAPLRSLMPADLGQPGRPRVRQMRAAILELHAAIRAWHGADADERAPIADVCQSAMRLYGARPPRRDITQTARDTRQARLDELLGARISVLNHVPAKATINWGLGLLAIVDHLAATRTESAVLDALEALLCARAALVLDVGGRSRDKTSGWLNN